MPIPCFLILQHVIFSLMFAFDSPRRIFVSLCCACSFIFSNSTKLCSVLCDSIGARIGESLPHNPTIDYLHSSSTNLLNSQKNTSLDIVERELQSCLSAKLVDLKLSNLISFLFRFRFSM